jgi:hypothetical protein
MSLKIHFSEKKLRLVHGKWGVCSLYNRTIIYCFNNHLTYLP